MANLRAVLHQFKMLGLDMFSAELQAMLKNHSFADLVAFGTGFDAFAQIVPGNISVSM